MELIQGIMREWYLILSQVSVALSVPIKQVADSAQLSFLSAFLFGLIGAMSPCQLTTNLSAMAFVSRQIGQGRAWAEAVAFTLGKVFVYTLVGGAVIFLGVGLEQAAIPIVVSARKAIGPLMIIIGLGFVGIIRLPASFGSRIAARLRSRLPQTGIAGAFSLGLVFSFTFCPTLFWLFFGLMIPLALISTGGWVFPGLFALGTTLPLLLFAGLLPTGSEMNTRFVERLKRSEGLVTRSAGTIFIVLGINDTLTYWFI